MIVLTAARLLCVLSGQIFEDEGGAPLTELVGVGVQAAGTGQLQELLPQLGRVSLRGQQEQTLALALATGAPLHGGGEATLSAAAWWDMVRPTRLSLLYCWMSLIQSSH